MANERALNVAIQTVSGNLSNAVNMVATLLGGTPSRFGLIVVHAFLTAIVDSSRKAALAASPCSPEEAADADMARELCEALGPHIGARRSGLVVVPSNGHRFSR